MDKRGNTNDTIGAFTLLELIVVIAVIGVLMTLLFPSLNRAKQASGTAVCLSNQKQIGAAFMNYSVENNQYFPVYGDKFVDNISWDDQLGDYDGRDLTEEQKREGVIQRSEYPDMYNDLYECPLNVMQRANQYPRSYVINNSYNKDDINDPKAIRGVAGFRGQIANQGQANEYRYSTPWSTQMSRIFDPANFIVLFDHQTFGNEMGHCSGGSGYFNGSWLAGNWAPINLPKHPLDPPLVGDYYVHEYGPHLNTSNYVDPNRPYRQNFLFGDGSARLTNVPSLYKDPTPYFAGTGVFWREMVETSWNALNGR
ncbi:MAG: type II secretion system GspH family protein [Lentisphaerales bacterium]|nr:type II secretion system GspH family protein [Lentisphaerales bacterium]